MPKPQILAIAAICLLGYTPEAQAYIDPTAAGAAMQSLYVILATALMAVAMVPRKVSAFFGAIKAKLSPRREALPKPESEQD